MKGAVVGCPVSDWPVRPKVLADSVDPEGMKAILSVAVYLALVFALGIVMALTSRREECDGPMVDDDF